MTSQVISPMPSVGVRFHEVDAPLVLGHTNAPAVGVAASWRREGTVKTFIGLCWVLGTCVTFLTVGVVGMYAVDVPWYELKTLEALTEVEDLDELTEAAMAELQGESGPTEEVAEEPVELPTEITEILAMPSEVQDLPELVEAMTTEDIFAIPTAPRIENAMRPEDPVAKPKPRPRPTPSKPRATVAKATGGTGVPNGSPGGMVGGVPGGTGTSRTGRLIQPKPPYPSFAASAGMHGRCQLVLNFGTSGRVESASIVSSTGYSSLDSYTADYIQRKWYYQGGLPARKSVRVPVYYKR